MKRACIPLALLILAGVLPEAGLSCRFNVRETGFVDLGLERYFAFCYVDQNTPSDVISRQEEAATEILRDTRVVYETVRVDGPDNHPALKYLEASTNASLPAVVLVSPEESTRMIPAGLEEVVSSPFRKTIVHHLARSYGAVLLIEGADPDANTRVAQAAAEAAKDIEARLRFLPKPISRGPAILTLGRDSIPREGLLLWSLGIDAATSTEPHAAVLYGRARRIGPVLSGEDITQETLYNILSVVGADCECGIDPNLFRGIGLPVRWGKETQAAVAKDLGFDPENPMIKTEVSQIMRLRATLYPWASARRERRSEALDELPIPFVEDTVDERDSPLVQRLLYTFAGLAGLALIGAGFLLVRARRRQS